MVYALIGRFVAGKVLEKGQAKGRAMLGGGSSKPGFSIEVDAGPLLADIRRMQDRIPDELGKVHRAIGQLVISKLEPRPTPEAVGTGTGAAVRPSASKREVLLRVGGAHRAGHTPEAQWGRRQEVLAVGEPRPPRPYIQQTARKHEAEIMRFYEKAVKQAAKGTFDTSGM